jgi:hypothetical protein
VGEQLKTPARHIDIFIPNLERWHANVQDIPRVIAQYNGPNVNHAVTQVEFISCWREDHHQWRFQRGYWR